VLASSGPAFGRRRSLERIPHVAALALLPLGTGCITTYTGPRLLSPSVPRGLSAPEVDSLQPTLTWDPSDVPGTTYDLVVLERSPIPTKPYAREGLIQTSHRIEKPLLPGREYVWAVRAKGRNTFGPWSSYNYFDFYVLWFTWGRHEAAAPPG
jgi:hypothetical protein